MDEKEKLKFLKQMGFSVGRVEDQEAVKKKTRKDNRVDKSELLSLARTFNVLPNRTKQQTLQDFLQENDKDTTVE